MHKKRRPRALTLTLPNAKQPQFVLDGNRYTLRNFSSDGLGLWVPPPVPFGLNSGQTISGDVVIGRDIFPVKLEIRHISKMMVGFQFVEVSKELRAILQKLMEPSTHASSLELENESGEEDKTIGHPRIWYAGPTQTDLVVWYNPLNFSILGLQACWQGKWIYRWQFKPAQTGFLKEGIPHRGGTRVLESDLIEAHEVSNPSILYEAAQFLTAVPMPLPGHLLWQFLELGDQIFLPKSIIPNEKLAKKA